MALQKIIDKILAESKTEADAIVADAHQKAEQILSDARSRAEAEKERRIKEAAGKFEDARRRQIALAKLEARKKILQARCDLIDVAFSRASDAVNQIPTETQRKLVENLLGDFKPDAPCEVIVYAPELDKYTLLLSTIWGVAFTKFCRVTLLKKSIGGGFILRTRRIEYDCTYARLISEKRQALELEVAKILSPEPRTEKK